MKQEFLDNLVGRSVPAAEAAVRRAGLEPWTLKVGAFTPAVALADTVQLYEDLGVVLEARAGDPCEVED